MLFFTVEKLKARLEEMRAAIIRDTRPITNVWTCPAPVTPPDNAMSPPPPPDLTPDEAAWLDAHLRACGLRP